MTFDIRPFDKTHTKDVAALECLCFSDPYSEDTLIRTADSKRDIAFVAEIDGRVIGYIELGNFIDTLCINRIEILPEFRKCGIASALMQKARQTACELSIPELSLEVRASNAAARSLYEKHGFVLAGKRPKYYRDPQEDAAVYILNLQTEDNNADSVI